MRNVMKVFIVTGEPFPNGMAATNRIKCYAKAFISQNVDCEVVIYRKTENHNSNRNTVGNGVMDGILFRYTQGSPICSSNYVIRHFESYTAEHKALKYLSRSIHPNDVILSFMGGMADFVEKLINLAHQSRAVFCRDLCELPYGTGEETTETIRNRKHMLEKVFPKMDGCIAISDTLYDLAKQYMLDTSVLIKIPIMVEYDKYSIRDLSSESKIKYLFHSGTLYEQKDGILEMLEAFAIAEKRLSFPIKFVIAGNLQNSRDKNKIESIISKNNIGDKVEFLGYLKTEQLIKPLSEASLVILNKFPNQQNHYGFSTKLGEYLAAGKPVIITRVGEAMNWLTDGENAYIIDHDNTQQLADTIVRAFENDNERKRIGENGRMLCQHAFDYKNYGKTLVEMCKRMTKQL